VWEPLIWFKILRSNEEHPLTRLHTQDAPLLEQALVVLNGYKNAIIGRYKHIIGFLDKIHEKIRTTEWESSQLARESKIVFWSSSCKVKRSNPLAEAERHLPVMLEPVPSQNGSCADILAEKVSGI
jgi:hypothetical protein